MSQSTVTLTPSEIDAVRQVLSDRKKIQEPLSKFAFSDQKDHLTNVRDLFKFLETLIGIQPQLKKRFIDDFREYVSCQQNIAIQINFRPLRYQQLISLFEEWNRDKDQVSMLRPSDRLYSVEHRNILFSRVFVEERNNIQDYFETLSQKKMLKAVDLYNLILDILSQYYLYEYASDNEVFFEKVNSFNHFLQVVQKFKHSEERINVDTKSKDFDYIKIYEFEGLIHFWQKINPELQLRSDVRFSIRHYSVQTENSLSSKTRNEQETQTVLQKQKQLNLQEVVNGTIRQMNRLTQTEQEPQRLQIIQRVCEVLRKQKILIGQLKRSQAQVQKQKENLQEKQTKVKTVSPTINIVEPSVIASQAQGAAFTVQNIIPEQLLVRQETVVESLESDKTERIHVNSSRKALQTFEERSRRLYNKIEEGHQSRFIRKQKTQPADQVTDRYNRGSLGDQNGDEGSDRGYKANRFHNINHLRSISGNKKYQGSLKRYKGRLHQTEVHDQQSQRDEHNTSLPQWRHSHRNLHKEVQQSMDEAHQFSRDETVQMLNLFEIIYSHYSKESDYLNVERLNDFFVDIGIIDAEQTSLVFNLIKKKVITNFNKIKRVEFVEIMDLIMEEDDCLSYQVIEEFVDMCVIKPQMTEISMTSRSRSKERRPNTGKYRYTYMDSDKRRGQIASNAYRNTSSDQPEYRRASKTKISLLNLGKRQDRYQKY